MSSYKHLIFSQDGNFLVSIKEGQQEPSLSEEALEVLKTARENACFSQDGWTLFDYQIKRALIDYCLLNVLIRAESDRDTESVSYAKRMKPYAWEAILFLEKWVCDTYPFRDYRPSK